MTAYTICMRDDSGATKVIATRDNENAAFQALRNASRLRPSYRFWVERTVTTRLWECKAGAMPVEVSDAR